MKIFQLTNMNMLSKVIIFIIVDIWIINLECFVHASLITNV